MAATKVWYRLTKTYTKNINGKIRNFIHNETMLDVFHMKNSPTSPMRPSVKILRPLVMIVTMMKMMRFDWWYVIYIQLKVHQLLFPRIRATTTDSLGCGFYYTGLASWNALPPFLRDPALTLSEVRQLPKTVLFIWRFSLGVAARAFVTVFC